MLSEALYILLITIEILGLGGICIYILSLIYSWLKGAPYVPTEKKEIDSILKDAKLTSDMTFLELGSGDGRVVRRAVEKYGVKGIGVDINPGLTLRAKMLAKSENLKNISFKTEDITDTDLSKADVLYIYLFPQLIKKMEDALLHKTKSNVFIISHGFKIPFLSSYLVRERKGKNFYTFYYK